MALGILEQHPHIPHIPSTLGGLYLLGILGRTDITKGMAGPSLKTVNGHCEKPTKLIHYRVVQDVRPSSSDS